MRILHTSDWHLGKSLESISRLEEQKEFVQELCEIADREDIHVVIVAGDIFDTYTPSSAAEELFYDAIDRLNCGGKRAVVIIAGNHDSPERLCAARPLAYKNGIILLGYPRTDAGEYQVDNGFIRMQAAGRGWLELQIAGCNHTVVIAALPYPSEARLEEVLVEEADELKLQRAYSDKVGSIFAKLSENFREDTVNIAVSHIFVRGGKESDSERALQVGGAMTVDPSVFPANVHYVALGHLHRPQWVKNANCPVCYSGSPLAYSFSETDYSKAVFVIDALPEQKADVREIQLSCGKPLKNWIAKNGIEEALQWCEEGKDKNAWIDLEIYTRRILGTEEQKRLRELHPGIVNIRPHIVGEEFKATDCENRETRRIDELFREYYKHRVGIEISDELMASFLEVINDENDAEDTRNTIETSA